jgi:hypothetical protein
MKQNINEIKRMQQLAGIISESQLNENEDLLSQISALSDFNETGETLSYGPYFIGFYEDSKEGEEDYYAVWLEKGEDVGPYEDVPEFKSSNPQEIVNFLLGK